MEVSAVNCGDVAVLDAIASDRAGIGYEYPGAAGTHEVCAREISGRCSRVKTRACRPRTRGPDTRTGPVPREGRAPGTNEELAGWFGDPAFPLTGGLESISVRLDKKIDRQGRRLMRIAERGVL